MQCTLFKSFKRGKDGVDLKQETFAIKVCVYDRVHADKDTLKKRGKLMMEKFKSDEYETNSEIFAWELF